MTTPEEQQEALKLKIAALEEQLKDARQELGEANNHGDPNGSPIALSHSPSLHTLLLLADSALPLGSFAFSSGLESFLAHKKLEGYGERSQPALFSTFLSLSLQSLASAALPYVLAAYRDPSRLDELDNDFDASTLCTVARRASIAQGKALLSVWERSFRSHYNTGINSLHGDDRITPATCEAHSILKSFAISLRASSDDGLPANAHLAPLWGVITLLLNIDLKSSAYLFLFSHARTVISAAVRSSVLGPYQAQAVLAKTDLKTQIGTLVEKYWDRQTEDSGQSVPVVDLWVGRHEKLYSRIFNS
jgi:urease accessory protein